MSQLKPIHRLPHTHLGSQEEERWGSGGDPNPNGRFSQVRIKVVLFKIGVGAVDISTYARLTRKSGPRLQEEYCLIVIHGSNQPHVRPGMLHHTPR